MVQVMREDLISSQANVWRLSGQLAKHYDEPTFAECHTMGDLVYASLERVLHHHEPASASMLQG